MAGTVSDAGQKLFCFGYGYSCDYLGYELQKAGWDVAGTTRDPDKKAALKERGVKAFLFDYQKPLQDPKLFLDGVTHLLISTPSDDEGDPAFNMHGEDILGLENLQWVGYLSSTSVYGDHGGDWVDESSELIPSSKRGSRRVKAEEQWLSLHHSAGLPVHIFRLAGIYGPGRSALDSVRAGMARRIDKPGHAFSRIHVADIVQVLLASMANPAPGEIYNVADDNAAQSHEVIAYACTLLGMTPPPLIPYEQADMAPMARSFYKDNKRIRNDKIKQALGVSLHYPDYKSGLQACLEAEQQAVNASSCFL
ncbi:MAG: SDR family oxidoreductase [Rhodospirillales bacterium]|nr:SDR family oxidoreductase [Rhodospirillales bacterium]MCB9996165.1 SDR family oxidoreductase [Rhodospirillales bacterium]